MGLRSIEYCLTCPVVLSLFGNGLMGEISWWSEGGWLIGIGKRLDWRQWREHEINLDRERGRRTPSTPGSTGETNCGPSMRAPWTNRRIWTRSLSEQLPSQPGFGHRCRICPLIRVCIVATSLTNTRSLSLSLSPHAPTIFSSASFHLLPFTSFHRVSHMCAIYLALKRTRLFRNERAWISVVTKEIAFRSNSAGYLLLCRRNSLIWKVETCGHWSMFRFMSIGESFCPFLFFPFFLSFHWVGHHVCHLAVQCTHCSLASKQHQTLSPRRR